MGSSLKATSHLTISIRGQHAMDNIQMNNYHHGSCRPSLMGKTMSVFLIFTQGTHRNVKNRWMRSSLKGYFSQGGIFRAERHFLLFEDQLAESGSQKTKENIIPRGKFRPAENGPNVFQKNMCTSATSVIKRLLLKPEHLL